MMRSTVGRRKSGNKYTVGLTSAVPLDLPLPNPSMARHDEDPLSLAVSLHATADTVNSTTPIP